MSDLRLFGQNDSPEVASKSIARLSQSSGSFSLLSITAVRELQRRFSPGKLTVFADSDISHDLASSSIVLRKDYTGEDSSRDNSVGAATLTTALFNGRACIIRYFDMPYDLESHVGILTHLCILKTFSSFGSAQSQRRNVSPHLEQLNAAGIVKLPAYGYVPKIMVVSEMSSSATTSYTPLVDLLEQRGGALVGSGKFGTAGHQDWRMPVKISLDVARAIDFLHRNDVAHREICVRNVLVCVDTDWHAKLSGFLSCCQFVRNGETEVEVDKSIDIFALGLFMAEVVTGRSFQPPSPSPSQRVLLPFPILESSVRKYIPIDCPEGLEALMLECIRADSMERPNVQTCLDVLLELLEETGGGGGGGSSSPYTSSSHRGRQRVDVSRNSPSPPSLLASPSASASSPLRVQSSPIKALASSSTNSSNKHRQRAQEFAPQSPQQASSSSSLFTNGQSFPLSPLTSSIPSSQRELADRVMERVGVLEKQVVGLRSKQQHHQQQHDHQPNRLFDRVNAPQSNGSIGDSSARSVSGSMVSVPAATFEELSRRVLALEREREERDVIERAATELFAKLSPSEYNDNDNSNNNISVESGSAEVGPEVHWLDSLRKKIGVMSTQLSALDMRVGLLQGYVNTHAELIADVKSDTSELRQDYQSGKPTPALLAAQIAAEAETNRRAGILEEERHIWSTTEAAMRQQVETFTALVDQALAVQSQLSATLRNSSGLLASESNRPNAASVSSQPLKKGLQSSENGPSGDGGLSSPLSLSSSSGNLFGRGQESGAKQTSAANNPHADQEYNPSLHNSNLQKNPTVYPGAAGAELTAALNSFVDVISKCSGVNSQTQNLIATLDRSMGSLHNPLAVPMTTEAQQELNQRQIRERELERERRNRQTSSPASISAQPENRIQGGSSSHGEYGDPRSQMHGREHSYEPVKSYGYGYGYGSRPVNEAEGDSGTSTEPRYRYAEQTDASYNRSQTRSRSLSPRLKSPGRSRSPASTTISTSQKSVSPGRERAPPKTFTFSKTRREFATDEHYHSRETGEREDRASSREGQRRPRDELGDSYLTYIQGASGENSDERRMYNHSQQLPYPSERVGPVGNNDNSPRNLLDDNGEDFDEKQNRNESLRYVDTSMGFEPIRNSNKIGNSEIEKEYHYFASYNPNNSGGSSNNNNRRNSSANNSSSTPPSSSSNSIKKASSGSHSQAQKKGGVAPAPTPLPSGFWRSSESGGKYRVGGWKLQPNSAPTRSATKSLGSPGTPLLLQADSTLLKEFYRADPEPVKKETVRELKTGVYQPGVPYRHVKTGAFLSDSDP